MSTNISNLDINKIVFSTNEWNTNRALRWLRRNKITSKKRAKIKDSDIIYSINPTSSNLGVIKINNGINIFVNDPRIMAEKVAEE